MEPVVETFENFDLNLSDEIPERYREDIKKSYVCLKKHGCATVYLFGSLVTGKTHDESDIDIGIKGLPPEKFFRAYADLGSNLVNDYDLVDFDSSHELFSLLDRLGEVVKIGS
jgi:predicted nucleotidyltransferase